MPAKQKDEIRSDQEVERIATDALRRALTTPYKPQKDMVGKTDRAKKGAVKTSRPKSA